LRRSPRGRRALRPLAACALLLIGAAAADEHQGRGAWPDTFVGRLEALAVLETLNADLLSHDSATLTLEHWCYEHRLATPARVVAVQVSAEKAATSEQRRELNVADTEPVRYRRVRLSCGAAVLSEADNWYVPSRLSAEMNQQLETSDTPFGKVVQALHFRRHTLAAELLWHPLPLGWEMDPESWTHAPRGTAPLVIPYEILQHRALLLLSDGTPISEVVETYTSSMLRFSRQSSPN
jgi:chorismate-pyruvate lyase